jgi:large subunit ribosomal protein LP0
MSSVSQQRREKKRAFIKKIFDRVSRHKQIIVVTLMNVGSNQVQQIRQKLSQRGGELVIGKNTVIRKALSLRTKELDQNVEDYEYFSKFGGPIQNLERLSDLCHKKVGLVFTDEPVFELRQVIEGNKVETAAKVGTIAPIDVVIPPGPTGLDPSQIGFFHALKISTKIQKGQIEIVKDFKVCEKGKVVSNSEATLLQKLGIRPFYYGMEVLSVYDDGSVLTPEILSISPDEIIQKFKEGVANLSALSLEIGDANEASVPYMIANAFKNIAAISLETNFKIPELDSLAAAPAQSHSPKPEKKDAKPAEKPKEQPKVEEKPAEEEVVDMGGLFD